MLTAKVFCFRASFNLDIYLCFVPVECCKNAPVSTVHCLIVSRVALAYLAAVVKAMYRVNVSIRCWGN